MEIARGNTDSENAQVTPESLHSFFREDGKVLGHLVLDSSVNGLSVGGIRMVPEISVTDLCYLARAMTLKCSFLKWPFGGAKAAILTHCDNPSPQQRAGWLESFARHLRPFRGRYLPGVDAGLSTDDLNGIRRISRLERVSRTPDSAFYTALTVQTCIEQLAKEQRLKLAGCTVAVEGFGKVGGWVAKQLSQLGCRIAAVSTKKGAIYHPDGLDVERLLRAREALGDDCPNTYEGARKIELSQLLTLPVDLLVPCALSWSIHAANAGEVKARAIVCGANNAATDKAKEVLAARGITCFPDFVSNGGGVLGSSLEVLCMDRARAIVLLREQFEPKVETVLARAKGEGRSPEAVAKDIAAANRKEMKERETAPGNKLSSLAARAYRCGLLPRHIVKYFAAGYIRRMMA